MKDLKSIPDDSNQGSEINPGKCGQTRAGPIRARLPCSSTRAGKNRGLAATTWEPGPARSAPIFELLTGKKVYPSTSRKNSKSKEQRTLILGKEFELVS